MDEAETHLANRGRVYLTETKETWRRLEIFGRDDEADDPLGRDLRRLGRNDRDYGNLADGGPILGGTLADGRPLLSLTLKPRSVKLTHH